MILPKRRVSWFAYVVRLAREFSIAQRDWIYKEMKRRGIGVSRYFAPIHLQPSYSGYSIQAASLKTTEAIASRTLALPFFNRIRDDQIEETCQTLIDLVRRVANLRVKIAGASHPTERARPRLLAPQIEDS